MFVGGVFYVLSLVFAAAAIVQVQQTSRFRSLLHEIRAPRVQVERLPVVRYLQSFAKQPKALMGVLDCSFDEKDGAFMSLVYPWSRRFLPTGGTMSDSRQEGESYMHGSMVIRILSKILPGFKFLCVRITDDVQTYSTDPIVCADDMHRLGVKIVIASLEFRRHDWVVPFSQRALELGMIVVYAAANKRMPVERLPGVPYLAELNSMYPGCVLWVGGDIMPAMRHKISGYPTTDSLKEWFFSAPGVNVESGLGVHTGSSVAAPIVAGVLGLLMELFPSATPKELVQILRELSKTPIGITAPSIWYYTPLSAKRIAMIGVARKG